MVKTVIIDDELKARETLKSLISLYCPTLEVIGVGDSIKTGIDIIKKSKPSLVFLDIEMPSGNGFQLLEQLGEINFEVIFTTAHSTHAIKAIKYNALDYILKPIDLDELKDAVSKAAQKIKRKRVETEQSKENGNSNNANHTSIAIPTTEGLSFLKINEIIACLSEINYTKVYMLNGEKVLVSKTLKEFEELLNSHNFFRIHNSSLVNINHIAKYFKGEGGYIQLSDGTTLEVSRRRKQGLLEKFATIGKY